ncbi:hypothetical protein GN956_G6402 [Arapaima gigas]
MHLYACTRLSIILSVKGLLPGASVRRGPDTTTIGVSPLTRWTPYPSVQQFITTVVAQEKACSAEEYEDCGATVCSVSYRQHSGRRDHPAGDRCVDDHDRPS